jgi:hypothetical protein
LDPNCRHGSDDEQTRQEAISLCSFDKRKSREDGGLASI